MCQESRERSVQWKGRERGIVVMKKVVDARSCCLANDEARRLGVILPDSTPPSCIYLIF